MMALPETRISLLTRLNDHADTAAWSEFCEIYERAIYGIAKKYGLQDADAHEVSQDVLLILSRKIRDFDPDQGTRFRSWLSMIARNATIDLLRKNKRSLASPKDAHLSQVAAKQEAIDSHLFDLEARREQFRWSAARVREGVAENVWKAFWMTAVCGEEPTVVAGKLGMSVGSVYVARSRILAKIRRLVEPFREEST
jgi:RNA polymerase sigma factor (sigma-70 family)